MSRPLALAALATLIVLHGTRVDMAEQGWTPDLVLKVRRVGSVLPSPDGARVTFVVSEALMEGETSEFNSQIHVANTDGSGSFQLTRGDKSSTQPRWSPDGQWIAFLSARGGDRTNLFRIRVAGGEAEQLTSEKGSITTFAWAPDGTSIAFVMPDPKSEEEEKAAKEKRDPKVIEEDFKLARLYVVPVEKNSEGKRPPTKLTGGERHVTAIDWSPDGRAIAFSHQRTPKVFEQNDISIVTVSGGEPRPLVATSAHESSPSYSRDGRSIAFLTSDDPPTWAFTAWVRVMPAEGGAARPLAKTFDEQPDLLGWSADDRALHDLLGDYPDETLQSGFGGRGGDEPHELHRHGRHPGVRARLFRRRVLGRVRPLARAVGDVQREGGHHGDADSARRAGPARARLAGLRAVQRADPAEGPDEDGRLSTSASRHRGAQLIKDAMERNLEWFDRWVLGRTATTSLAAGPQR